MLFVVLVFVVCCVLFVVCCLLFLFLLFVRCVLFVECCLCVNVSVVFIVPCLSRLCFFRVLCVCCCFSVDVVV